MASSDGGLLKSEWESTVCQNGAIMLGTNTVCDGYSFEPTIRVQTHVHLDHMGGFSKSLRKQHVICLEPTWRLIVNDMNGTMGTRINFQPVDEAEQFDIEDGHVTLFSSNHMLGSAQVLVEMSNGYRVGYSGDFFWPMESPISVDELVVDATNGSEKSIRLYSQKTAEDELARIVNEKIISQPVLIYAHRGTLQRALAVLGDTCRFPIVASDRQIEEAKVYSDNGYPIGLLFSEGSEEADSVIEEFGGRYVRVTGRGDERLNEWPGYCITLSTYFNSPNTPVLDTSEESCSVGFSNHADFEGTVEYVRATGASRVLTDNTRGRGIALAVALKSRIDAEVRWADPDAEQGWVSA